MHPTWLDKPEAIFGKSITARNEAVVRRRAAVLFTLGRKGM
ncbi:hypothetical protein ACFOQM_03990 [Paenibacillus sp. GCM10012307]|nr:hypothetical protein [Paenibacillus roseus]